MHNPTYTLAADLLFVGQLRNEVKLRSNTTRKHGTGRVVIGLKILVYHSIWLINT